MSSADSLAHHPRTTLGWSLGLRAQRADQVVRSIRRGFSVRSVERIRARLGLSMEEVAGVIGASKRTLARRQREGRLESSESDRLYRLARLYEQAVDVFEEEEDVRRWFRQPQWALGGQAPLSSASTDPGAREVELLLQRIEHSVLT